MTTQPYNAQGQLVERRKGDRRAPDYTRDVCLHRYSVPIEETIIKLAGNVASLEYIRKVTVVMCEICGRRCQVK